MQHTIWALWNHLKDFHRKIYVIVVFILFYELLKLAPAAVLAIVIDTIVVFDPSSVPLLLWLFGALFVASMIVSLLDLAIDYCATVWIDFPVGVYLLDKMAQKLLRLSLDYHERHQSGRQVHILHQGLHHLRDLVYYSWKEIIPTLIQLLLTIAALLWVHWMAGLTFILFLPIFLWMVHAYGKRVQPLRRGYHEQMDQAAGHIGERIMHIRTVQDYAVEKREIKHYQGILRRWLRLGIKRMEFYRSYFLWRDSIMNLSRVVTMGVGIYLVMQGAMTPGVLVFFITLSEKANLALFRLTNTYNRCADSAESVRRFLILFDQEEAIRQKPKAIAADPFQGEIAFEDVTFSYHHQKPVLQDIRFTLEPKKMLAIIGRSGSGKSTIVKLLYRHYDVGKGAIKIDGRDIRDYRLESFRRQIALVPQDIEIFNESVKYNIAFGNPKASDREIKKAAKMAYAHDFIKAFPEGYDTLVGERGVKLSGGQRQRIGIARALLANPSILVFDEATSSLDTQSEQLIQKAMEEIAQKYTMIVIAHRLSTIEHADAVMVLEDGVIVEMGSHQDLLAHKGVYTKMRELQKLGEIRK